MKISKITIDNFRSFEHLEIFLGNRLTLLIGENGSGKTTVLDALSIVLGAVLTYLPRVTGVSFKKTDLRQIENKLAPYTRCVLNPLMALYGTGQKEGTKALLQLQKCLQVQDYTI